MTEAELRLQIYLAMLAKSGVREWENPQANQALWEAAILAADGLQGIVEPDPEEEQGTNVVSKLLITPMDGTPKQIVFGDHSGDFNPTAANDLRITTDGSFERDVQAAVASLANGSYWQSAKFDFGDNWAEQYDARMAVEMAATPTSLNTWTAWLGYSHSATAGTANPANLTGSSAAYTGYSSNAAAAVAQLHQVSVFSLTAQATATVQVIEGWRFSPRGRYGILVLLNSGGSAHHSDDVEFHVVFNPVLPEQQ